MEEKFIPLSVPNLRGNELRYVTEAVQTEWVSTAGPYVRDFEEKIAAYAGVPGAVSCQSGTAGLHIALLLCGVVRGDAVLVPTLTFIAAVNPVKYIGAEPVFMDCDDSLCMDPVKLEAFCREECDFADGVLTDRQTGRRVRAIVVVHVFGNMADMPAILAVARKYGLKVVEDATEALGTRYTGGPFAGRFAGTMGDMGVYSFNGNKILTTGGGGMIISRDEELLRQAKHLTTQAKSDEARFYHDEIGYNYRLTNLQAALGLGQMEQLEDFIAVKARRYERYAEAVRRLQGAALLGFRDGIRSNRWFYSLYCGEGYRYDRDGLIAHLAENRVQSRPIWGLISDQKPYAGARTYRIEQAPRYWAHVVNLPCSTGLTDEEQDKVIRLLES